ncbi:MAG: RNA-binding cell elongation regulator Jag/EloR [Anaerolineales bacterium]
MTDSNPSLEMIAPTVDEAIERGAAELGIPADDLDVEVLDGGSRGVLGVGARQARVRLTVRKDEPEAATAPASSMDSARTSFVEGDDEDAQTQILAREAAQDLLRLMDVTADVNAHWGEADSEDKMRPLFIDIDGEDLSILIGRRGETLDAFQYIIRLILGKELKQPLPLIVDVAGYRARREQTLRRLARRMADQAVERERTLALEPMPPNERRIIHIELRDNPKVHTESVGEGNQRKVTIIPER